MALARLMSLSNLRLSLLLFFQLLVALVSVRGILGTAQGLSEILLPLLMAVVVTLVCIVDSRIVGKPMPHAAQWVMLMTWPLAVPIYLIWSRRAKGFLMLVMHIAFVVGNCVAVALIVTALEYLGMINGTGGTP